MENVIPENLEEAVEVLEGFLANDLIKIKGVPESQFVVSTHHGLGRFIRNNWDLWSDKESKLVKWFKERNIVHPDDISGIIFTSLYRRVNGLPINIQDQIDHYLEFWKKQGYADGIPQ